jgi:hypothetical protein
MDARKNGDPVEEVESGEVNDRQGHSRNGMSGLTKSIKKRPDLRR